MLSELQGRERMRQEPGSQGALPGRPTAHPMCGLKSAKHGTVPHLQVFLCSPHNKASKPPLRDGQRQPWELSQRRRQLVLQLQAPLLIGAAPSHNEQLPQGLG